MTRDLRRYARQTNTRLVVGFVLILFLVGDGLIFWIYGRNAALMGLACIAVGLAPLVLVWLLLTLVSLVVKKINDE